MSGKIDSLYICPWSLNDPLCRSQSLAYVSQLADAGYRFAFITFEIDKFQMDAGEAEKQKALLIERNIAWHPVKWDGGNSVVSKMSGIMRVVTEGAKICFTNWPKLIHSRTSLPAIMAVILKRLFGVKYLYDADSLLSEEYADTGHLSRESSGFRFLAWSEKLARNSADRIILLTERLKSDYREKFRVTKQIDIIPCCVDLERFKNADEQRDSRRLELGITNERLFVYVGKAGSWYLIDETFDLFEEAVAKDGASHLLIVTQDDPAVFAQFARGRDIPESSYSIRSAEFQDVPSWMAASDVAISLIKPLSSKRGSSPVKFAEYLASGLPVIANPGIGDVDELILHNKIGTIVEDLSAPAYAKALDEVGKLGDVRGRCREVAYAEFDLETVGGARYKEIYLELLGK